MPRVAATLWVGCGLLAGIGGLVLPMNDLANRPAVVAVGMLATVIGVVVWVLPWQRWGPRATLALVPIAMLVIASFNRAAADPWIYSQFFLVAFVWVGLAHRPGTPTLSTPFLVAAYLAPLLGRGEDPRAVAGLIYVLPTCLILGEAAAWVSSMLRRAEEERATSEARYAALVRQATEMVMVLGEDGTVLYTPAAERVLGPGSDDLVGTNGLALVHPDDHERIRAWFDDGRDGRGELRPALCRMGHHQDDWRWVEVTLSDLREDPSVGGLVVNCRDVTERVAVEEQLAHSAGHDSLTGLPNRAACFERLGRALERGAQQGAGTGVLFVDLDRFKIVNDSLGHHAGDDTLVAVGNRLRSTIRSGDHLARLGGDEFVVITECVRGPQDAREVADRVLASLERPVQSSGRSHQLTASIGITYAGTGQHEPAAVLRQADMAMHRAKELGGGRWEVFDEVLARRARRQLDVETELRLGLEQEQLVLHYQPELELITGSVVAVEALARWQHPTRGLLPPSEFIDIAERSTLIVQLGALVLQQACRDAARWRRELGHDAPQLSVNVSARQLADPGFTDQVGECLAAAGLPADQLRLEITESLLLDTVAPSALVRLQDLGVSLAIDDFGTGYSSLSYLDRLPVDVVKIDRGFLQPVVTGNEAAPVVEAILAVASSLGLDAVAEGVETPAHLALLDRLGCYRAQGYYFSRPIPLDAVESYIVERCQAVRSSTATSWAPRPG
jgi:diguanylate cyclase (GGDEF)-like protein/PAS domain S-box-containing protein